MPLTGYFRIDPPASLFAVTESSSTDWHIAVTLGLLLGAAALAGLLAGVIRLPRVTAYLLVGLLLGPHTPIRGLHVIPEDHLSFFEPVAKFAMALVLFSMGSHFTFVHVRRIMRRLLRFSAGELSLTFLLVAGGLALGGGDVRIALLLGALALATAPATTVLVLKENASEGPVTEYAGGLVALNNLVSIVVFEVLFLIVFYIDNSGRLSLAGEVADLTIDFAGSIVLGVVAGLGISYACALLSRPRWLVVLIATTTLLLGVCEELNDPDVYGRNLPYLLTFLAMGVTVANASALGEEIVDELDRLTGLLCVVFFVIHGAEMNLDNLWQVGAIGVAYIVLRSAGKYFGIFMAADPHHDGPQVRRYLGATLLSQAGAAIALSSIAAERYPEIGDDLLTIILGTVIFFEIAGPLAIRQALIRAGEVPLAQAIYHRTSTPIEELKNLGVRLLAAMGYDLRTKKAASELTVGHLMQRNVRGIGASDTFDDVIDYIEHSRDNTYPVVGDDDVLVGVIRYEDIRGELFDAELGGLVCAADLAVSGFAVLHPDDEFAKIWEHFRRRRDDAIVVVSRKEPHRFIGMVRRREALKWLARGGNG